MASKWLTTIKSEWRENWLCAVLSDFQIEALLLQIYRAYVSINVKLHFSVKLNVLHIALQGTYSRWTANKYSTEHSEY